MTVTALAHAKKRPPSSARRWLSCPESVSVVPLYPNDETDKALKGTIEHAALENGLLFGLEPNTGDIDADYNLVGVLEYIASRRTILGKGCTVYPERKYDIPETGEFGTCDVTYVGVDYIEIEDYKGGYVPVEVKMNPQMMVYLLGAIAEFGEKKRYRIGVIQPNYPHADGPYRHYDVTHEDVEWFRAEVLSAVRSDRFYAGNHCKKTYCPHRGGCATFHDWQKEEENQGWFTSEINAISDAELAIRLDYLDTLQGQRDEARKEAMRRIMNMDRTIPGFALFKSKQDRAFADEKAEAEVRAKCLDMGAKDDDLFEKKPVSVAGIERYFKAYFRHMGNGAWKKAFDQVVEPHIRKFSSSLTLDRTTYGGQKHSRGSEFDALKMPAQASTGEQVQHII